MYIKQEQLLWKTLWITQAIGKASECAQRNLEVSLPTWPHLEEASNSWYARVLPHARTYLPTNPPTHLPPNLYSLLP